MMNNTPSLKGFSILVTRPAHQADKLCQGIEHLQGQALRFPTLVLEPVEAYPPASLATTPEYWVLWASPNAAILAPTALLTALSHSEVHHIPMGAGTAQALSGQGISSEFVPVAGTTSETLVSQLKEKGMQPGSQVLIVKGVGGREVLESLLQQAGCHVEQLSVYQRKLPDAQNVDQTLESLFTAEHAMILATSSESMHNLMLLTPESAHSKLLSLPLIVVSDRTKKDAEQRGFKDISVAESASDQDLIECLLHKAQSC